MSDTAQKPKSGFKKPYVPSAKDLAIQAQRDKVFQENGAYNINPTFSKAFIRREELAEVMSAKMHDEAGVIISSADLLKGGTFGKEVDVYNNKGEVVKGTKDRKGYVKAFVEGPCGFYAVNHATGEEIKGALTIDDCDKYLASFNKSDLDKNGFLRKDLIKLPTGNDPAPQAHIATVSQRPQVSQEELERQRLLEEQKLAEQHAQAAQKCQARFSAATQFYESQLRVNPNLPDMPHGNHHYLVNKYGDYLERPEINMYLQNVVMENPTKPTNEQMLLVPAYRASDDKLINVQPIGYVMENGVVQTKENGKPAYDKKYSYGAEKKGMYLPLLGHLNDNTKLIVAGEGFTSTLAFALGSNIHKEKDLSSIAVVSAFDAGNAPHVVETLKDRFPQATILYAADNDYTNFLVDRKTGEKRPNNSGLKAAKKIEEMGVPVIYPSEDLLHGRQSDWDDVFANIRTHLKEKNGADPSFDETMQYFAPLVTKVTENALLNFKERIQQQTQQQQQSQHITDVSIDSAYKQQQHQTQQQERQAAVAAMTQPNLKDRSIADDIVLASSNSNFKKLIINVMQTMQEYAPTADWKDDLSKQVELLKQMPIDTEVAKKHSTEELGQASRNTLRTFATLMTAGTTHNPQGIDNKLLVKTIAQEHWVKHGGVNPTYANAFNKAVESIATASVTPPEKFEKPRWLPTLTDAIADKIIESNVVPNTPQLQTLADHRQQNQAYLAQEQANTFKTALNDPNFKRGASFLINESLNTAKSAYDKHQLSQLKQFIDQAPATNDFPKRNQLQEAAVLVTQLAVNAVQDKEQLKATIDATMPVTKPYKTSFMTYVSQTQQVAQNQPNQSLPAWAGKLTENTTKPQQEQVQDNILKNDNTNPSCP